MPVLLGGLKSEIMERRGEITSHVKQEPAEKFCGRSRVSFPVNGNWKLANIVSSRRDADFSKLNIRPFPIILCIQKLGVAYDKYLSCESSEQLSC